MKFISTRNKNLQVSLSEAIYSGMPQDGGLYVPEYFPVRLVDNFFSQLSYPEFAAEVLKDFFVGDVLASSLPTICKNVFNFPMPLKEINANTLMLELFHGPTLSFKDFGARFLAECLHALSQQQKITIMVATSGDTGSAVAAAFHGKNVNVIVLYPRGKISARQEQQITCWGDNVLALAVDGTFDDCQKLVKSAFNDAWWKKHMLLSTANSINIGRLLPQITYYAYASTKFYTENKIAAGFVVPSGNLGNVSAAYWAKAMGFPIREIVIATNANRVISDYLRNANYQPRASIQTLANAMDVGNPSNFERLQNLFSDFSEFSKQVKAFSVSDEEIHAAIKLFYQKYNLIVCPHTATACFVKNKLTPAPWIIVATADPCKFEAVIEPLINQVVEPALQLRKLLSLPTYSIEVSNNLQAVKEVVIKYFDLN